MTTADVLRRAADVIEERGWTRGQMEDRNGRVCAVGALRVVCLGSPEASPYLISREYLSVYDRLCAHLDVPSLDEWNDHQPSQQYVVAAFREAAAAVEAVVTRRWRLSLPDGPHLTANQRLHWADRFRRTACWRHNTKVIAREARIPALPRIGVHLEIHPPDRRRRDPSNWAPTQKACVDGLVDARVVPDDSPAYVVEGMPRLVPPASRRWRWWLVVTALPPAELEAA